jgi:hypothetical protein
MNKEKRKYLWFSPLLLLVLVCGCLLTSGTVVIVFTVNNQDIHVPPGQHFYKFTVNLEDNDDWRNNKDKLNSIEDMVFTFKLANPGSDSITGQVYVSEDSTLSDTTAVKSHATLILDGITVPPHDTLYVNMEHYYDLLHNFDTLRDLVKGGVFTAYGIVPSPFVGGLFDAVVIVTVDAGL